MRSLSNVASLAMALLASASAAGAQVINYSTTGMFSSPAASCNQTVAASTALCTGAGFSLLFTGRSGVNIASGSITSLGSFLLTGMGNQTVGNGAVNFTLDVNQTTPTNGTGALTGSITGTVSTVNGNLSSLVWTPNQTLAIQPVTYTLVFDNVGPGAGRGLGIPINNDRGINALVTSTPEPSSYALMAAGLTGLLAAARRRRDATA